VIAQEPHLKSGGRCDKWRTCGGTGFEAARRIRGKVPGTAVVILSTRKDKQFILLEKACGACAFVEKSRDSEESHVD
jgi:DNA-binding NarL/FixJ family response regulator